jgi:hypothetical protein
MPLSADDVGSSAFSSHLDLSRRHDAVSADDDDNADSVSVSRLDPSSLFSNFLMGKAEFQPSIVVSLFFASSLFKTVEPMAGEV